MSGKKSKNDAAGAGAGKAKKPRDILTDEIGQLAPGVPDRTSAVKRDPVPEREAEVHAA